MTADLSVLLDYGWQGVVIPAALWLLLFGAFVWRELHRDR